MISFLLLAIFLPSILTNDETLSKSCESVFTNLKCICEKGEDFIVPPIYEDIIKRIKIIGCASVRIDLPSFNNLLLEELEFRDIGYLFFSSFSLSQINDISSIRIENVANLTFDVYSTKGMKGVEQLVIKNSFVGELKKESFSFIFDVKYMLIENTTFSSVEELAFNIHSINTLHVKNSRFGSFENSSIYIHDSKEVLFQNCEFLESVDNTFSLVTVDSVAFQGCTFGYLASTFIHSQDIQEFTFSNCTIDEIKPDAFAAMDVLRKVSFENNIVKNVYPDSLFPFLSHNYTIESDFCCNYFPCDCSMHWIWEYAHPNISVLENSLCLDDPERALSSYIPIMDSSSNCSELKLIEIESTPSPSTEYSTSSSGEVSNNPNMISLTVKSNGISHRLNLYILSLSVILLVLKML